MKNTINISNMYDLEDAYNHLTSILEERGLSGMVTEGSDTRNELMGDVACEILDGEGLK